MKENRDACLAIILARGLARAQKRDRRMPSEGSETTQHAKQNVQPDFDESPIIAGSDEVTGGLADNQNLETSRRKRDE